MKSVKFIPLSFIKNKDELNRQIQNTIVFNQVLLQFKKVTTLGKLLLNTQYGYTASAKQSGTVRLLRITDLKDNLVNWNKVPHCDCDSINKYRLKGKDILVARTGGTTGKSFIVNELPFESVFASYLIRMTVNAENNPVFVHMFLNSYFFWSQIVEIKRGSAQPNVNAQKMKGVEIPICPKQVQDEIVDFVFKNQNSNSKIISKIKKVSTQAFSTGSKLSHVSTEITHQQAVLKKLRQSILQDAISGKLTEQWRKEHPDVEPASGLLERIKAEKERLIKEKKIKKQKPLPPIKLEEIPFDLPKGWVWCRLGEICTKMSTGPFGSMLHKSDYVTDGIPLVNPINLINNKIIPNDKMLVDTKTQKRLSQFTLYKNDVIIARRGDLSKCAIVSEKESGWVCGTGSFYLTLSQQILNLYFIRFFVSLSCQNVLTHNSVGSTMDNLNQKLLKHLLIPLPSKKEQNEIEDKAKQLFAYCDQLEQQIGKSQKDTELLMQAVLKEAFER